jgi:hypothetical protein
MRTLSLLLAALLLMGATGCATVVRGDAQNMKFNTDPAGARLLVNGAEYTTPAVVALKRNQNQKIEITREGYRPVVFEMKSVWDGAALGNAVLPGGSLGAATDRVKGSDLAFYKVPTIKLTPATAAESGPIELFQYRKRYLTREEYEIELAIDREEARTRFPFDPK